MSIVHIICAHCQARLSVNYNARFRSFFCPKCARAITVTDCQMGIHTWAGCTCSICGTTRDEEHDWTKNCELCAVCSMTRANRHSWLACKCSACGMLRDEEHDWTNNCAICANCGRTRLTEHIWNGCTCSVCGTTRNQGHDWQGRICKTCRETRSEYDEHRALRQASYSLDKLRQFIAAGGNLYARDPFGNTALHLEIVEGWSLETVTNLLAVGARPSPNTVEIARCNMGSRGRSALPSEREHSDNIAEILALLTDDQEQRVTSACELDTKAETTTSDIKFSCPACAGHLVVDKRGAGMSLFCSHCGSRLTVPQSCGPVTATLQPSGRAGDYPACDDSGQTDAGAAERPVYAESDNRGCRHDTAQKAMGYWMVERRQAQRQDPFVMFEFKNSDAARKALLGVPCIKVAKDTGNLICTMMLIFGFYETEKSHWEAVLCGDELTHDLWKQAKKSFEENGGTLKTDKEPKKNANLAQPSKVEAVKFVLSAAR